MFPFIENYSPFFPVVSGESCDDPTDLTSQQPSINHINKSLDNQIINKNNLQHLDALNEKYNLQNYSSHLKNYEMTGSSVTENSHHIHLQHPPQHDLEYLKSMKSLDPGQPTNPYSEMNDKSILESEPNNNTKNNSSSSSSYDDPIDYEDSIQNHDLNMKDNMVKRSGTDTETLKYKCNEYMKNFDSMRSRSHYEELQQQSTYNGGSAVSDDYRVSSLDDRKISEDGNSNDMRMNYASSDELNQTTASSDHGGEKAGSGSDDEGNMGKFLHFDPRPDGTPPFFMEFAGSR